MPRADAPAPVRSDARSDARRVPTPLPVGLPLLVAMLLVLRIDRTLGLTSIAVIPLGGFRGGFIAGGVEGLLTDVIAVLVVLLTLLAVGASARPRARGTLLTVLVLAAVVGLQLGTAAAEALTGAALPTDLQLARGLLLAGTTMAALLLLADLAEHRGATRALLGARAAAETLATSGRASLVALREDVAVRVRAVLRDALGALEAAGAVDSGARLRALADEVLRPLSHRLAATPARSTDVAPDLPPARWRDTLVTLLRVPIVPTRSLALIAAGLVFLRSTVTDQDRVRDLSPAIPLDAEGVGAALTVDVLPLLLVLTELALVLVVTWWGAVRLADLLERSRDRLPPGLAWALVGSGIGAISVVASIGPALINRFAGMGTAAVAGTGVLAATVVVVASFLPLLAVTVGVSLAAAVAADRRALQLELARESAEAARTAARVQAVLGHEQRRLARSLHADVQATINAAGLMLERADRAGAVTPTLVDDVAARIATAVERFLEGGASTVPLAARLAEVRALWSGVCTVALELDGAAAARVDADTVTRELIVDLVTEACANAVVHGGAGAVEVRIGLVGDGVELEIVDDGTRRRAPASQGEGADGLGTQVLRASCTSFTVDIGERGCRLHAEVPLG